MDFANILTIHTHWKSSLEGLFKMQISLPFFIVTVTADIISSKVSPIIWDFNRTCACYVFMRDNFAMQIVLWGCYWCATSVNVATKYHKKSRKGAPEVLIPVLYRHSYPYLYINNFVCILYSPTPSHKNCCPHSTHEQGHPVGAGQTLPLHNTYHNLTVIFSIPISG